MSAIVSLAPSIAEPATSVKARVPTLRDGAACSARGVAWTRCVSFRWTRERARETIPCPWILITFSVRYCFLLERHRSVA